MDPAPGRAGVEAEGRASVERPGHSGAPARDAASASTSVPGHVAAQLDPRAQLDRPLEDAPRRAPARRGAAGRRASCASAGSMSGVATMTGALGAVSETPFHQATLREAAQVEGQRPEVLAAHDLDGHGARRRGGPGRAPSGAPRSRRRPSRCARRRTGSAGRPRSGSSRRRPASRGATRRPTGAAPRRAPSPATPRADRTRKTAPAPASRIIPCRKPSRHHGRLVGDRGVERRAAAACRTARKRRARASAPGTPRVVQPAHRPDDRQDEDEALGPEGRPGRGKVDEQAEVVVPGVEVPRRGGGPLEVERVGPHRVDDARGVGEEGREEEGGHRRPRRGGPGPRRGPARRRRAPGRARPRQRSAEQGQGERPEQGAEGEGRRLLRRVHQPRARRRPGGRRARAGPPQVPAGGRGARRS